MLLIHGNPRLMLLTLLLTLLLFAPATAGAGSAGNWTSAAFRADPADCPTTDSDADTGACPAGDVATKLSEFPYWDRRSTAGGGTHIFLGTANGFLWSISCDHCGYSLATSAFVAGTYSGQTFDSLDIDDVSQGGAYRQFNVVDGIPAGSVGTLGDVLHRWQPQGDDTLPDVPFMPILRSFKDLADDTLMLTMDTGNARMSTTLGWFAECAITAEGGNPGDSEVSRDACCTDPYDASTYDPASGPNYWTTPSWNPVAPTGYGGEGTFSTCMAAGLTYLGPVRDTDSATWTWATFHWKYGSMVTATNEVGFAVESGELTTKDEKLGYPTWTPSALGYCTTSTAQDESYYTTWQRPVVDERTHVACGYEQFIVARFPGSWSSNIFGGGGPGSSGTAKFAYIDSRPVGDRWVYVGSGIDPRHTNLHTLVDKSDWDSWIWGVEKTCDY